MYVYKILYFCLVAVQLIGILIDSANDIRHARI